MDKKSKEIIAGFSGTRARSQLAPYRKLILELHRRGCSFRKIAPILSENFGLNVASTTISRFVLRLEKEESKPRKTKQRKEKPAPVKPLLSPVPKGSAPVSSADEIRQRIEALKQRTAQPEPDNRRFEYDPDQPLHLVPDDDKSLSG